MINIFYSNHLFTIILQVIERNETEVFSFWVMKIFSFDRKINTKKRSKCAMTIVPKTNIFWITRKIDVLPISSMSRNAIEL